MAKAKSFSELVSLVRQAEAKLVATGVSDPGHRLLMLRGIYYGPAWSLDYKVERSAIRNLGFQIFTGFEDPPDPRPALGEQLFNDLQASAEVSDRGKLFDVGHALIGVDARRSVAARGFTIPTQGGTGLDIVTWLGDLGGGAAALAWRRSTSPNRSVSTIFPASGSDYGASVNLEGDVGGFLIGRQGAAVGPPIFAKGQGVVEILERYLPVGTSTVDWQSRCADFLRLMGGSVSGQSTLANPGPLISAIGQKIETFAVSYMTQRFIVGQQKVGKQIGAACAHLHGAAVEVAGVFVQALVRSMKNSLLSVAGTPPWPKPSAPGACNHQALQLAADAPDHKKTIERVLEQKRRDAEQFLQEARKALPF